MFCLPIMFVLALISCSSDDEGDSRLPGGDDTKIVTATLTDDNEYFDGILYYQITSNVDPKTVKVCDFKTGALRVEVPGRVIIDNEIYLVTDIGKAFAFDKTLNEIILPETITSLEYSFTDCINLKIITLPNSLTLLNAPFNGGVKFEKIYSRLLEPSKCRFYSTGYDWVRGATLYVPKGTIDKYKENTVLNKAKIVEIEY